MATAKNITNLSCRIAVVVEGTTGLGKSIASSVAARRADVVASGRRKELIDDTAAFLESLGRRTLRHEVDVGDRASIDALRDHVLAELGRVDILVNAAGRTLKKEAAKLSENEWLSILDT